MSQFISVGKVGDIQNNQGKTVEVDGRLVAVFYCDGQYYAIDDLCPHAGASLGAGYVEDCTVLCPLHAWRFDVRDGTWADNRKLKVDSFEVKVEGDEILVASEPTPASDETDSSS